MFNRKWTKENSIAAVVAILLHLLLVGLLLLTVLPKPQIEEQGAVLVNIGDVDLAAGTFTPHPVAPETTPPPPPAPSPADATRGDSEELLTQEDADAPVVTPPKQKKVQPKKQEQPKPSIAKPKPKTDNTETERRAAEAKRAEEARRQKEQEEARRREAIGKTVSGAFGAAQGKGSGDGATGDGQQGSPDGNVASGGANTGVGGFGSFDLSGRSLRGGGLPRPEYTSQIEGTIVVRITVDPSGNVIQASIASGTNISDSRMRQGALTAARAAKFNTVEGINNQTGTITYRYRLR